MFKKLAIVVLAVALVGCGTAGKKIDWNNARAVKAGMTTQEVTELMGKPHRVTATGSGTQRWVWVYVNGWTGASQSAFLTFKDGKVEEAFSLPDSFK